MPLGAGSPPRMRGKDFFLFYRLLAQRITPAYAGKSLCPRMALRQLGDHPRVCGEKAAGDRDGLAKVGSPPRMRGKAGQCQYHRAEPGITPAYAGKRALCFALTFFAEDHPRVCGEKFHHRGTIDVTVGSPPRMRGKAVGCGRELHRTGITPAYAGKSFLVFPLLLCRKDHPRVCGEKRLLCRFRFRFPGSPPRMRGKGGSK